MSGENPLDAIEYTYHPPLIEDTALEFVIGLNDADIFGSWMPNENPEGEETLWEALKRLEAEPDTWKLDIEVRDEDGCTMVVIPLFEKEAP